MHNKSVIFIASSLDLVSEIEKLRNNILQSDSDPVNILQVVPLCTATLDPLIAVRLPLFGSVSVSSYQWKEDIKWRDLA